MRRLRRRPNGVAAEGGRPIGSVFLINLVQYTEGNWNEIGTTFWKT